MAKLTDLTVMDFSGGLVTNKSDIRMQNNEFKDTLNFEFDEDGKAKQRRGMVKTGNTLALGADIAGSFLFQIEDLGNPNTQYHILLDVAANATIYILNGAYLTTAVALTDTTVVSNDNTEFTASGNLEINGDDIGYTGRSGIGTFTGATGIGKVHANRSLVHQWESLGSSNVNTNLGVYFALLNNLLFINGVDGSATFNGVTSSAVSDADEPTALFATNYRERIYVAGSGQENGVGTRNGSPKRVSFSNAGDATAWDLNDFFDVEEERGEMITGLREHNDRLNIFKMNSVFLYDEVQLKQVSYNIGAYNHFVVQKIDNLLYTFCPRGIFVTNGVSFKPIWYPIKKYIQGFHPIYDTNSGRIVTNCFAGQYQGKYYLFLDQTQLPDGTISEDVVLVYDTVKKNWTVFNGYTNFTHFANLSGFHKYNNLNLGANTPVPQVREKFFAGDPDGQYWMMFENRYLDNSANRTPRGGDVIPSLLLVNGSSTPCTLETRLFDWGLPHAWKKFGYVTAYVESGDFTVSYRIDKGDYLTDWKPLGLLKNNIHNSLRIPRENNEGYRISLMFTSNSQNFLATLNGFSIRDSVTSQLKDVR